jgi:pantetheine-phosphate adenylyltransferase
MHQEAEFEVEGDKGKGPLFRYKTTCIGGTFDYVHSGHRLILTLIALITDKFIKVGVSSDTLLTSHEKCYAGYIERAGEVLKFLKSLNPHVNVEIYELDNPIGLCGSSTDIDACILTRESEAGGILINEKRAANGLSPLKMIFVDQVVADVEEDGTLIYSNKRSVDNIRDYVLKKTE